MKKTPDVGNHNLDLDGLFEKYRRAPDSHVFVPLADACRKTGQIEEALEICARGVERHPNYPSGHVVRGKCLFDRGDRRAAREAFERVLTLDEGNLVALKYLGTIEADLGNLGEAQRLLQQILAVDPENKEIKDVLRVVEEQGQIQGETGVSGAGEAGEADEVHEVDEVDEVDEILGASESPEGAAASDEEIEPPGGGAKTPGDTLETSEELASITLADIFASQGYTSKAEKIYREVLRKQPDNKVIQKRLLELAGECEGSDPSDDLPITPDSLDEPVEMEDMSEDEVPEPESPTGPEPEDAANTDDGPAASSLPDDDASPGVTQSHSLGHFKRWLNQMQK